MAEKATIARPYARAAFAYARNANALAAWATALNTAATVVSDGSVSPLIGNPKVAATQLLRRRARHTLSCKQKWGSFQN